GQLVGVFDAVCDYPEPGEWWIGLPEPTHRAQGLGESTYHAFESRAGTHGAQGIHLTVLEQKVNGARFWRRLGFDELERKPPRRLGALLSVATVLRLPIAASR